MARFSCLNNCLILVTTYTLERSGIGDLPVAKTHLPDLSLAIRAPPHLNIFNWDTQAQLQGQFKAVMFSRVLKNLD